MLPLAIEWAPAGGWQRSRGRYGSAQCAAKCTGFFQLLHTSARLACENLLLYLRLRVSITPASSGWEIAVVFGGRVINSTLSWSTASWEDRLSTTKTTRSLVRARTAGMKTFSTQALKTSPFIQLFFAGSRGGGRKKTGSRAAASPSQGERPAACVSPRHSPQVPAWHAASPSSPCCHVHDVGPSSAQTSGLGQPCKTDPTHPYCRCAPVQTPPAAAARRPCAPAPPPCPPIPQTREDVHSPHRAGQPSPGRSLASRKTP